MCEPVSATTAVVLGVLGAASSVAGAGVSASASLERGGEDARQQLLNAALSREMAGDAVARGRFDAGLMRMKASRDIAKQRVAAGASGATLSGSTLSASEATRYWGEVDAETTMNNAFREAWGYRVQEYQHTESARMTRKRAAAEARGHLLNGALGAVGGLAKLV